LATESRATGDGGDFTRLPPGGRRAGGVRSLSPRLLAGAVIVLGIVLVALFGSAIAPRDPLEQNYLYKLGDDTLLSPFRPVPGYWLGTDAIGRDILSRLLAGAGRTLAAVGIILVARLLLGIALGLFAGWFGGWLDDQLSLLMSWISAFPTILFAILLLTLLRGQRDPVLFVVALCAVGWTDVAAFVRHQVQDLARAPFVEGAVAIGSSELGILRRHVAPNLAPHLLSLAALEASSVLLLVAELGFLGYFIGGGLSVEILRGSAATSGSILLDRVPEWGQMVGAGRDYMLNAPWVIIAPGASFAAAILGFNLLGEGLREALDSRQRA
jgi:ABC-type dipeptide/oligopeptide/nickel transport system permease subunit